MAPFISLPQQAGRSLFTHCQVGQLGVCVWGMPDFKGDLQTEMKTMPSLFASPRRWLERQISYLLIVYIFVCASIGVYVGVSVCRGQNWVSPSIASLP